MLQNRSDALIVVVKNTIAGGNQVTISNSAGWIVGLAAGANLVGTINTIAIGAGQNVSVTNSAGWIVAVSNTQSNFNITNSAGWVFAQSNTGNQTFTLLNSSALSASISNTPNVNVTNSAGWVFAQSNTNNQGVIIQNSGGLFAQQSGPWVTTIANTGGTVLSPTIANTAGWVIAQSNTAGMTVNIVNSSNLNIANSAGWVIAQSNTAGISAFTTMETRRVAEFGSIRTPKFATIAATATANSIIAAVAGSSILVLAVDMMSLVGNNAKFQSGTAGTDLTGVSFMGSNGGIVRPFNPVGWFKTATNTLLNLSLSQAQSVGGCIVYVEIS